MTEAAYFPDAADLAYRAVQQLSPERADAAAFELTVLKGQLLAATLKARDIEQRLGITGLHDALKRDVENLIHDLALDGMIERATEAANPLERVEVGPGRGVL